MQNIIGLGEHAESVDLGTRVLSINYENVPVRKAENFDQYQIPKFSLKYVTFLFGTFITQIGIFASVA